MDFRKGDCYPRVPFSPITISWGVYRGRGVCFLYNTPSTSRLHESARSWRNGHETAAAAGAHGGGLPALVLPASTPQNTALGSLVRHVCPTRRLSTPLSSRSPPPRASSIAILRLPAPLATVSPRRPWSAGAWGECRVACAGLRRPMTPIGAAGGLPEASSGCQRPQDTPPTVWW